MVWGMLMPNGFKAVKVFEESQNAAQYMELVKTFCVPIITLAMKPKIHMVQDN